MARPGRRLTEANKPVEQAAAVLRSQFGLPPPETSCPVLTCGPPVSAGACEPSVNEPGPRYVE